MERTDWDIHPKCKVCDAELVWHTLMELCQECFHREKEWKRINEEYERMKL